MLRDSSKGGYLTESEQPLVFWTAYIIYLIIFGSFIFYAFNTFTSQKIWILLGIFLVTSIVFPFIYLVKHRNSKRDNA